MTTMQLLAVLAALVWGLAAVAVFVALDAQRQLSKAVRVLPLILLAWAAPCSAQTHGPALAVVIGNTLDAATTEIALRRPGAYEANPLLGQASGPRLAVKATTTAAEVWIVQRVGRAHPTAARVLGYSIGAVTAAVAWRNLRLSAIN